MKTQFRKCLIALCLLALALWPQLAAQQPPTIDGEWDGKIAGKLRVIIRLEKTAGDAWKGVLESPDQGGLKLPMDAVSFDGSETLRCEWKSVNAVYEAKLRTGGSQLEGTWQQGNARVPLTLRRPGAASPPALQSTTRGVVRLDPCQASDGAEALCGTYEVYENRATRTGRRIALNLMLLPALAPQPAPDPVFAFAGGPGESAVNAFPLTPVAKALQQQRDIVMIDQRGTGKSNLLQCPLAAGDAQALIADPYPPESLRACRAGLEKHADLTQYTTAYAIDDADELRAALGYDKVNLLGGSYGSLAALVYLRRHGEHVRSMAIEAVAPPDYRIPLAFAKAVQSSLERLFANCTADPGCHKDFPDLKDEFEATMKRLDKEPAKFDFTAVPGAKPQTVTLSRGQFVTDLRPLLYQPAIVARLPYILHRSFQNDWAPFATVIAAMHGAIGDGVARGMSFSVICSESLPFIAESDIRSETAGTYLGDFDVRRYQKRCDVWPRDKVDKGILAPVESEVPALLIAGMEDPATPAYLAERVSEHLSHSRLVKIPHGTHLTSAACTDNLIVEFIRSGSEKQLDASCAAQIRTQPFLTLNQIK